jgi:hypothetical protein
MDLQSTELMLAVGGSIRRQTAHFNSKIMKNNEENNEKNEKQLQK